MPGALAKPTGVSSDVAVSEAERVPTPLEALQVIADQEVELVPGLRHLELFTMRGLLTLLWHGEPTSGGAVVMCGGAMGGLLGPAGGLYHRLGNELAGRGIATVRVSYRRPNDLDSCCLDAAAAVQLAVGNGAERVVVLGHSFGGARRRCRRARTGDCGRLTRRGRGKRPRLGGGGDLSLPGSMRPR